LAFESKSPPRYENNSQSACSTRIGGAVVPISRLPIEIVTANLSVSCELSVAVVQTEPHFLTNPRSSDAPPGHRLIAVGLGEGFERHVDRDRNRSAYMVSQAGKPLLDGRRRLGIGLVDQGDPLLGPSLPVFFEVPAFLWPSS
jgi:hypothetical protein